MKSQTITGTGLGLYFGCFVMAALLGLPRMYTYLAASAVGALTVAYAMYTQQWQVERSALNRWQCVVGLFLGIVCVSYFINRDSYDVSLTLKVIGYASVFCVSSTVAMLTGYKSMRACMNSYLTCLLFAIVVTLAVNNTNSHNHRLLGPTHKDDIQGSGLHHNEVGLLGMTTVMLATISGWRAVLLLTPPSVYIAYLSGSRGSMLGIVIALLTFAVAKEILAKSGQRAFAVFPKRAVYLAAGGFVAMSIGLVLSWDFVIDDVLQLNSENRGLSSGFTGRLDVWEGMLNHWRKNPVVGQGYGIVRGEARSLGETADGGYLLLTSEVGMAGLFLFLALIYQTFKSSLWGILHLGDCLSITTLVFLAAFCFINIFESRFVGTGSIGLGIFIYLASLSTYFPRHEVSVADGAQSEQAMANTNIQRALL